SFSFSRKTERRRPLPAGPCAEPGAGGDTDSDTDFLTAVEDRELLRWAGEWARPPRARPDSPDPTEARQSQEQPNGDLGPPISIPLQLPDKDVATGPQPVRDPQSDLLIWVPRLPWGSPNPSQGPSNPSLPPEFPPQPRNSPPGPPISPQTAQDYEAVPVGQFGLAMLRGMGWSQGQGIGRTFPKVVTPLEHRPRPRGLGLGAEAAPPGTPKPGEPSQGGPAVGDPVCIEAGPHRGMEGKVEALDPETGRALVRLQLGGQVVAVNQHGLRPKGMGEGSHGGDPPRGGPKRKEPPENERWAKQPRGAPPVPPHWLRRDLRVRCVDRAFQGGRFYNCKMQIEDLLAPDTCVCRTDDGRLVEGEPPREGNLGAPLTPPFPQVGRILEREPDRGRALVQLGRAAAAQVLPLPYDSICHYLGGGDDD
ncbi:GPKOW protein, partial [Picathartes gymnocephalus]|nr:GPKOW protein [Picathartes gymnocephalus]